MLIMGTARARIYSLEWNPSIFSTPPGEYNSQCVNWRGRHPDLIYHGREYSGAEEFTFSFFMQWNISLQAPFVTKRLACDFSSYSYNSCKFYSYLNKYFK